MEEDTKICPYCKSVIPKSASHCAHCGKNVTASGMLFQAGLALFLVGLVLLIAIFFCSGGIL